MIFSPPGRESMRISGIFSSWMPFLSAMSSVKSLKETRRTDCNVEMLVYGVPNHCILIDKNFVKELCSCFQQHFIRTKCQEVHFEGELTSFYMRSVFIPMSTFWEWWAWLVRVVVGVNINILAAGDTLGNSQHRPVNSPVLNIDQ